MRSYLSLLFVFLSLMHSASAETFETPRFTFVTEFLCPEGVVVCDNIRIEVTVKDSNEVFLVRGSTWHTLAEDGITPKKWLGYRFRKSGNDWYLDRFHGLRIVDAEGLELLSEKGDYSP